MGKKNDTLCSYLAIPEVFADCINGCCFGGKRTISAEQLSECSQIIYGGMSGTRSRDVVKGVCNGRQYAIIGIEGQDKVHQAMPLRCLEYDMKQYREQLRLLRQKNLAEDKTARWESQTDNSENDRRKLSDAEFLSGIRDGEKLNPVITIVLYHGNIPYNGCLGLRDMLDLEKENQIFEPFVADYKMNLVTFDKLDESKFATGFRELAGFMKRIQNRDELMKYRDENKERISRLDEETYTAISVLTGHKKLLKNKEKYREDGGYNMCKGMKDWEEFAKEEGKKEGKKEGIEKGLKKGKAEGEFGMLYELVKDGAITLEYAAAKKNLTVNKFQKELEKLQII